MFIRKSNQKGFTLIELLIVVMIIGILSGVMLRVINIDDVRKKTRDSQRISDMKKIQTALELYFVDHRAYPVAATWADITGSDVISTILKGGSSYINQVPTDPQPGLALPYKYKSSSGATYFIVSTMELVDDFTLSPCTDNPYGTSGCYEVQNPL